MALLIPNYNGIHRLVRAIKDNDDYNNTDDCIVIENDKITIFPEQSVFPLDINGTDFCYLDTGDIIEITKSGRCFRRFEMAEKDATIYMGGQCNSNCVMCPSFDRERQEPPEDEWYIRKFIELLPPDLPNYVVTGGEPTMQLDMFFEAMGMLAERLPKAEALLLTNGRSMSSDSLLNKLIQKCPPFLTAAIPIHGSNSIIHDKITQAPGSYEQTIHGIRNLLNKHIAVEIRIVVTKINKDDIEHITDLICSKFPSVLRVNFISLEVRGNCLINKNNVYISPKESFEHSRIAIQKLLRNGIDVGLYNYPLCNVDPGYWFLCKKSISPNKVRYPEKCDICSLKEKCGGMFITTMKAAKPEIFPM